MTKSEITSFGVYLLNLADAHHLTRKQFADRLGVTQETLSRVVHGKVPVSEHFIDRIIVAFEPFPYKEYIKLIKSLEVK